MNKLKRYIQVALFLALGPGVALLQLYLGNLIQAFLWSLPVATFILAFLFPGSGAGHFALTHEFGPVLKKEETEKKYHLKMAKWWFVGSLTFPLVISLADIFKKYESFMVVSVFVGTLFGVSCFIKGLGSLFNAARSES